MHGGPLWPTAYKFSIFFSNIEYQLVRFRFVVHTIPDLEFTLKFDAIIVLNCFTAFLVVHLVWFLARTCVCSVCLGCIRVPPLFPCYIHFFPSPTSQFPGLSISAIVVLESLYIDFWGGWMGPRGGVGGWGWGGWGWGWGV